MECLVTTQIEYAVMYRRGFDIKSLMVLKGEANNCNTAGDFADASDKGMELLQAGYQQIVVWPVV